MTTTRHLSILCAAFLLTTALGAEELPARPADAAPSWAVSGTTITVRPDRAVERGFLRVVGPRGYRASTTFGGGGVSLDLLADGRVASGDRVSEESGAAGAAERTEPSVPAGPDDLTSLPDGPYRFEVVLSGPGGTSQFSHVAWSRGGSLATTSGAELERADGTEPQPVGSFSSAESSGPTTAALAQGEFAELVEIRDENDSGVTGLDLQANDAMGGIVEEWRVENNDGDLRIVEKNDGTANSPRMTLLQDLSRAQVGLGTTAPATSLHIASITAAAPRIRLEDGHDGVDDFWDLRVVNGVGVFARAFSILDSDGDRQFVIYEGAPNLALEIDASEVRIGTNLAVLSSRDAKENLIPVDSGDLLERLGRLPIYEWEYRDAKGARHLGPTAEEFREQFALGSSDRTLSPTDLGGVALAAVQGLQKELDHQRAHTRDRLAEKTREVERLRAERAHLESRLEKLEAQMEELLSAFEDL